MNIEQLLNEHKKGVKAIKYNKKPQPHIGADALKSKEQQKAKPPAKTELQKHKKLAAKKPSAKKPEPMGESYSHDTSDAKERLAHLEKIFDPSYEYSDDHSEWKKHNEIRQEMDRLKKIIRQGVEEAEGLDHSKRTKLIHYLAKKLDIELNYLELASDDELVDLYKKSKDNMSEGSVQDKLYKQHQELRKKSGLPDPEHYKKLGQQKQKEIDDMKKSSIKEVEMGKIVDYKPGQTATLNTGPGMTTILDLKKNPTSLTKDPTTGKLKLMGPQAQGTPGATSTQASTIKPGDSVEIEKTMEDILKLSGLK